MDNFNSKEKGHITYSFISNVLKGNIDKYLVITGFISDYKDTNHPDLQSFLNLMYKNNFDLVNIHHLGNVNCNSYIFKMI